MTRTKSERQGSVSAPAAEEAIHALEVRSWRGRHLFGVLSVLGVCGPIAAAILLFGRSAGRDVTGAATLSLIGGAVFAGLAWAAHRSRRRELRILKRGVLRRLVVARDGVEIAFPLTVHAAEIELRFGRVPSWVFVLQVVSREGGGIVLRETRGALQDRIADWSTSRPLDPDHPGPEYELFGAGKLEDLRRRIERINETVLREEGSLPPGHF